MEEECKLLVPQEQAQTRLSRCGGPHRSRKRPACGPTSGTLVATILAAASTRERRSARPSCGGPVPQRHSLAWGCLLLFALGGMSAGSAEQTARKVDQAQTSEGSVVFGLIRTNVYHAQQFAPTREKLHGVSFFIRRQRRGRLITTSDLKVALHADKKDEPDMEELASVVVPYQSVKVNENCWVDAALRFDGLVPGRKYWLVFTIAGEPHEPNSLPATYILEGDYGDRYPQGLHKYHGEHSDLGYPVDKETKNSWKDWEYDFSFKTF